MPCIKAIDDDDNEMMMMKKKKVVVVVVVAAVAAAAATMRMTISKLFRECMSYIPGKCVIKELQKQPYCAVHIRFGKY